jgi:hypothetical protein
MKSLSEVCYLLCWIDTVSMSTRRYNLVRSSNRIQFPWVFTYFTDYFDCLFSIACKFQWTVSLWCTNTIPLLTVSWVRAKMRTEQFVYCINPSTRCIRMNVNCEVIRNWWCSQWWGHLALLLCAACCLWWPTHHIPQSKFSGLTSYRLSVVTVARGKCKGTSVPCA